MPEFARVLYFEGFDGIYSYGMTNAEWVIPNYGTLKESWSLYALQRSGTVSPFIVPALDATGHTNVACGVGAFRLWVKPYWSSALLPGGTGPGTQARLVELAVVGNNQSAVIFSLQASPNGSVLELIGASDTGPVVLLKADISWQADEWHSLVLNYGSKTELYIDGQFAADGAGTLAVPTGAAAMVIASTLAGTDSLGGEVDDIYFFDGHLTDLAVALSYGFKAAQSQLGPISPAEDQAWQDLVAKRKAELETGGQQMMMMQGSTSECVTNAPFYITNIVSTFVTNQGWTVTFDVQGTNGPVDIYTTTNLSGNSITNSQWVWLERGPSCSTYQYTNQPSSGAFYVLGGTEDDPDSDQLPTAYEQLVSKSSPTDFTPLDTDGDGIRDWWEIANALNPRVNDANEDPDGDWLPNVQEYNDFTNPHDVLLAGWGNNTDGQCDVPLGLRPGLVALAGGLNFSLGLREDLTVAAWGATNYGQTNVPATLTNVAAIAAGEAHALALKEDGTVVAWGRSNLLQTIVPASLTNAVAISAGGHQSLALRNTGTVVQWGDTNATIPGGLTSVKAIASGTNFHVALLSNTTVVAWGTNTLNQLNVPGDLTNVVAIAAGGAHALALKENGIVVSWGNSSSMQTNVPNELSNVLMVAAGNAHSVALKNTGEVVAWGNNSSGQTNVPSTLSNVKTIAAGGAHTLAAVFVPTFNYPINVSQDLLLVCNTNCADSVSVLNYYRTNRPGVASANVLGIGGETTAVESYSTPADVTSTLVNPVLNWLTNNPTKRPQFILLSYGIPGRNAQSGVGTSFVLSQSHIYRKPFVNHLNMRTPADCYAYVDKLAQFGSNYAPGKIYISPSQGNYGNTNFVFSDTRSVSPWTTYPNFAIGGYNGCLAYGASVNSLVYSNHTPVANHITVATNVAGFVSWGAYAAGAGSGSFTNGSSLHFYGNSGWWIIQTVESHNGRWNYDGGQSVFHDWFDQISLGGTNYENAAIGAVSYTVEPAPYLNNPFPYFGLWQAGKPFAICAWVSRRPLANTLQPTGDPFVRR